MHIAMFAHYSRPHAGGIETVVEALTSRLAARHTVTLVSTDWAGLEGPAREGARTTWRLPSVHVSERYGVPYPVPTGRFVREAMAEAARADVVHVHGALYAHTVLARRMARRA
ncbi:MAG: glycosyltransferase, partial [Gemmatimonadetes bacterium]|nr:glycosyltransferase [Gemmatimonadota bacterium]